jgi:hypothetical protein
MGKGGELDTRDRNGHGTIPDDPVHKPLLAVFGSEGAVDVEGLEDGEGDCLVLKVDLHLTVSLGKVPGITLRATGSMALVIKLRVKPRAVRPTSMCIGSMALAL